MTTDRSTLEKLDTHYSQQLSALMDGDLPPDQARFLLRRLEHDTELTGRWERWQLCGDVLRGQAQAPAPTGFADQIAAAIAAESTRSSANAGTQRGRSQLVRWGGGALAASVAVIALFMARQQVPEKAPAAAVATVAGQSPDGNPAVSPATTAAQTSSAQAPAAVTAASVAVASVPRRDRDTNRRSATRTQQAARAAANRALPERQVATAGVPVVHAIAGAPANSSDPFSNVQINTAPTARPWPRAVLPQYSAGSGAFTADYSSDRAVQAFYPFEPKLEARPQASPPVTVPESGSRER